MAQHTEFRDSAGSLRSVTLIDFKVQLPAVEELIKKYGKFISKNKPHQIKDEASSEDDEEASDEVDLEVPPTRIIHLVRVDGRCVVNLERLKPDEIAEKKPAKASLHESLNESESETDYLRAETEEETENSSPDRSPIRRRLRSSASNKKSRSDIIPLRKGPKIKIEPISDTEANSGSEDSLTSGSETDEFDETSSSSPNKYNLRKRERASDSDSDVPGITNKGKLKKKPRRLLSSSESEDDDSKKIFLTPKPLDIATLIDSDQSRALQGHSCSKCKCSFVLRVQLNRHMKSHKRKRRLKIKLLKTSNTWGPIKSRACLHSKQKYWCSVCSIQRGKKSTKKLVLPLKKKSKLKIQNNQQPCKFCLRTYKIPSYLKIHQEVHCGDNPYHCSACLMRFPLEEDLQQHRISHSKLSLKFIRCCYCSKKFSGSRLQMIQHLRTKHRAQRSILKPKKSTTEIAEFPPILNFGELIFKEEEDPNTESSPISMEVTGISTEDVVMENGTSGENDSEESEEVSVLRIVPIEKLMELPPESPEAELPLTEVAPVSVDPPETLTLYFTSEDSEPQPTEDPLAENAEIENPLVQLAKQYMSLCPYCKYRDNSGINSLQAHCVAQHATRMSIEGFFICPHLLCNQKFRDIKNMRIHQIIFHDMLHVSTGHDYCTIFYREVARLYTQHVTPAEAIILKMNMKHLLTQRFRARIEKIKLEQSYSLITENLVCPLCSNVFQSYNEINNHALTFHADLGRFKFKCPHETCERKFGALIGLIDHELLVHQVDLLTPRISEITSSTSPTPGPSCSVPPSRPLPDPNISSTTSPPISIEQCPYCPCSFKDVQDLNSHGYKHANFMMIDQIWALKYTCPYNNCNSLFDEILQVRTHVDIHKKSMSVTANKNPQLIDLTLEENLTPTLNSTVQTDASNAASILESLIRNQLQEISSPPSLVPIAPKPIQSQAPLHPNSTVPDTRQIQSTHHPGSGTHSIPQSYTQQQTNMQNNQVQRFQGTNVHIPTMSGANVVPVQQQHPFSNAQPASRPTTNSSMPQHAVAESWTCDKCMQPFSSLKDLSEHYRNHYEFICYFCKIRFLTEVDVRNHMKVPHQYSCTFADCPMSFETPIHLDTHLHYHAQLLQRQSNQLTQYRQLHPQNSAYAQSSIPNRSGPTNSNTQIVTNGSYLTNSNNPSYLSTQTLQGGTVSNIQNQGSNSSLSQNQRSVIVNNSMASVLATPPPGYQTSLLSVRVVPAQSYPPNPN